MGMLKKATSGVPCLRRSGYAQAGHNFVVLTYWQYAPRAKIAAALLDDFFDHSRRLPILKSSRAHTGFFARNIQQALHQFLLSGFAIQSFHGL
jgi:hypothetical protein